MTNVEMATTTMPKVGESIDVGAPVVKGVIERVLPCDTVLVRNGDNLLFAQLNKRGYYEQSNEPWANTEYVAMRRAELMPKVGDKFELSVTTYIGRDGGGGDWGDLGLCGTVKAIDSKGCCKIQIEPF